MAWGALLGSVAKGASAIGKGAVAGAKGVGRGAQMARNIVGRRKKVKGKDIKGQQGGEEQEKGGALAIRPTTSLVPTGPTAIVPSPGGDLAITGGSGGKGEAPEEILLKINSKLIRINKLLKGSLVIRENQREAARIAREKESDKKQEQALEKVKKPKSKFKMPKLPGQSLLSKVFTFFTTVAFGWLAVRLMDWMPKIAKWLPVIGRWADWILEWGGKILNVLAGVIDLGYKLVNGMESWVKNTFGEEGAEKFRTFMGNLKDLISAFLLWKVLGEKILKAVVNSIKTIWKTITKTIRTIWVKLRRLVGRHVRKFFGKLVERAGGFLKNVGQGIFNVGKNVVGRFGGLFGKGAGAVAQTGVGKAAAKVGGWAVKIFGKAAKFVAPALKAATPAVKGFAKRIPIMGPLIVALVSLMSGEGVGQALFKGIGAAIGGALGTFIPIPFVGTLLGEAIGTFVGDLLFYLIIKRDPKKALEVFKQTLMGIFTAGTAIFNWVKKGFGNFITNFKEEHMVQLPKVLGVQVKLPGIGDKIPNLLQLYNPFAMAPLLVKSFFGGEQSGGKKEVEPKDEGDVPKGLEKQEEALIATNQESGAQGVIDSISNRASYEEPAASSVTVTPIKVPASSPGTPGGEEGSSSPMIVTVPVSGPDPYEVLDFFG